MRIIGVDMTSAPTRRKPITVAICHLDGDALRFEALEERPSLADFEALLARPGPWVAGLDFPFGQARRFVETIGWPASWPGYVATVGAMTAREFEHRLNGYKAPRPHGDKQHFRAVDRRCGGASPQTLHYTPVGRMFFRGAPALLRAEVHLPGLRAGDRARTCVEAYPGILARRLLGRVSYKSDSRARQTGERAAARRALLDGVRGAAGKNTYGLRAEAPDALAADPTGDALDAFLCAVQAAWAFRQGFCEAGPPGADTLEGWIADPAALG